MSNYIQILFVLFSLSSCASTSFYHDGKKIASFQGDMKNVNFHSSESGHFHFSADEVNHSTPTSAYGKSSSSRIEMIGTAIGSAGLFSFIK